MKLSKTQNRFSKILQEIATLGPMRKGSITRQFVDTKNKDGSKGRRGPYPLYTAKKRGKTVSKRIPKHVVRDYEEQIARFRRFEDLIGELMDVAERLADTEVARAAKKGGSKN